MPRTTENKITNNVETEIIKELLIEFKKVNSATNLNDFFKKFMTNGERDLVFRRIAIIKFIKQGKKYHEIKKILRVSDNTISNSVDIILGRGYGQNPNRKRVFSKKYIKVKSKYRKYKGSESIINIINDII